MNYIETDDAPAPGGHYSQAVEAGGVLYLAGQLPFTLEGTMPEGIAAQARQVLSNAKAILNAAGSGLDHVLTATVFVDDIANWPAVDAIWREAFGDHRPARAVAVSPQLHHGALVEIQITALAAGGAGVATTDGRG